MENQSLFPHDAEMEKAVLGSIIIDPDQYLVVRDVLNPADFHLDENRRAYEGMIRLWDNGEPIDQYGLVQIAPDLQKSILDLPDFVTLPVYAGSYAKRLKRLSELRSYITFGAELVKMAHGDQVDAQTLYAWVQEKLSEINLGRNGDDALLTWAESFPAYRDILAERERLAGAVDDGTAVPWDWPWQSWKRFLDDLDPGMLTVISAPDGTGKTVLAESMAEHWARRGHRIVFVHFELSRELMLDRRMARATGIPRSVLKSGRMGEQQMAIVADAENRLAQWSGNLHYLHTPGWSMERVIRELDRLIDAGECDGVVIDYLEKARPSERQDRRRLGEYQVEKDNVEILKDWSESRRRRMVLLTQFNKEGKKAGASVDRSNMRGAGEKSERANIVILAVREKVESGECDENGQLVVEPGGYSRNMQITIDKNTMGSTGRFDQFFNGPAFSILDYAE